MTSDTIEKGDIVWLEYDAYTVSPAGTQTLFDTTHEDVAKKEDKFEEKKVYAEQAVVVGKGRLFAGLEEALLSSKVGDAKEVTIPPEKGAGARDGHLVELRTEREFLRQEITPELGMEVSVGGRRGTITSVAAGRVRVDFNNPLAGKTLKYMFKIAKRAEVPEDRIRAILEMDYGLAEQFKLSLKDDVLEVGLPDLCKTDEKWFVSKFRVVADLRELTDLHTMRFVEEYEKKVEAPKEEKPAEEKVEEKKPTPKPAPKKARQPKKRAEEKPAKEESAEEAHVEEERSEEELPPEESVPREKAPEEL